MRTVLVNVAFRDKYTKKMYVAGKTYEMSEERIAEIKEVNSNFITVIGVPKDTTTDNEQAEGTKNEENQQEEKPKKTGKK